MFFAEPVDVRIAALSSHTDAKDPDELLKREGGREVFDRVIAAAVDPLELLFARVRANIGDSGLSARARVVEEFVAKLVDRGRERVDKVRYQLIIKRLSQIAGVDWETISGAIASRRARVGAPRIGAAAQSQIEAKPLGPADGPVKNAIFGENNARLYKYEKRTALATDRLSAMKAGYEQDGARPSNLRYGYVVPRKG